MRAVWRCIWWAVGAAVVLKMIANSEGVFQISSKVDSVTIQGVKLNRGNCIVKFSQIYARAISVQDFKDEASAYEYIKDKKKLAEMQNKVSQLEQKGVMMEPQTLKFGENLKGISKGCNIIEATIQTDKGSWTFNFDR